MLKVVQLPVLQDNYTYLLHCPESGTTACVDSPEVQPVLDALQERGWTLSLILNTHHHWDHVQANLGLKQATGCKIIGAQADAHRIPGLDRGVQDGEQVMVGEQPAVVMALPGHTTAHIAYSFQGAVFSGDTLFVAGCGRLLGGSAEQMWASLSRLAALPEHTLVYGAHEYTLANLRFALSVDPDNLALRTLQEQALSLREQGLPTVPSTIAQERATNPFLRAPMLGASVDLPQAPPAEIWAALRRRKDTF